uniref:C2H2-type domain-containing protein n=1 Tax=Globisporangium ultimum (strain ATCC 200006 / CBS 805.95 / DAOM BR144) TaxID=431595 RepID=K3WED9_GLOUD
MEQLAVLANGKCRRRYSPEHALFAAGNALRSLKYYQEGGSSHWLEEKEEECDADVVSIFQCRLLTCNVGFRSVAAYEEHYDLVHRNVCLECYQSFMSLRLLDIHISERHDAFFKVLSKKKPMYVCLVDGCEEVFMHDDKRTRHLVQMHKYPSSFSFHRPRRVNKSKHDAKPAHKQQEGEKKKKRPRKKKSRVQMEAKPASNQMEIGEAAASESADPPKKTNMQQADSESGSHEGGHETKDVEMVDELAESMKNLRIPKNFTFGRRGRRWL